MKYSFTQFLAIAGLLIAAASVRAHSPAFKPEFVDTLIGPYLQIQQALASDDLTAAKAGAQAYLAAMDAAPSGEAAEESADLKAPAEGILASSEINAARTAFAELSVELKTLVKHVGSSGKTNLFVAHCPMALGGKGADWLQSGTSITNPFLGSKMPHCGSIQEQIVGEEPSSSHDHGHAEENHEPMPMPSHGHDHP